MSTLVKLGRCLNILFFSFCPCIYSIVVSEYHERRRIKCLVAFLSGFGFGQFYFQHFLKDIQFLFYDGSVVGLIISLILGVAYVFSIQMRCISVLLLPMYCGKAGRGVLKAIVLSYVVAGPITNMGLNAKEIVRVYACSTQLSSNISKTIHGHIYEPLNKALLSFSDDISQIKNTFRSVWEVISPLEHEVEGTKYLQHMTSEFYLPAMLLDIESCKQNNNMTEEYCNYDNRYARKMRIRCENEISHAISTCLNVFSSAYNLCRKEVSLSMICSPLISPQMCDVKRLLGPDICSFKTQMPSNLSRGLTLLKMVKQNFTFDLDAINLIHNTTIEPYYETQAAKEAGQSLMQAFHEKYIIMEAVFTAVNICVALLLLRIAIAAVNYHDLYLTSIDYDNVYVTGFFKKIDLKRRRQNLCTLLPLKKMERTKYTDVHSTTYIPSERSKLFTQILKVTLEAITATTFVMLDRLFYEALDVVRQYALEPVSSFDDQDIEINIKGKGELSNMIRKLVSELALNKTNITMPNETCLPRPRAMPTSYYIKIYGGYLWILLLLYINPYTLRLRRYFYPIREKQRVLHLYNDILKKRMKIEKTLRRKAVQAVRAHWLSGENLLSLRMRYPQALGWLATLPVARMKCLICAEPEPRCSSVTSLQLWHTCLSTRCPFVYCNECWQDVGKQCLACDPALAGLSDVDSLSGDSPPRY